MAAKKKINKQLINICFLVILISVTVVVIFTANDIEFGDIFEFLKICDPWWIVGAVGLTVASVLFESISLHFIMRGLGEKPKFYHSTVYASADLYYSAITPSGTGGQPASIYYMVKDGIGAGKSSFGLIFNLTAYTLATIVVGVVAIAVRPEFFSQIDGWFPKLLVIVGFVIQGLLLGFFIGCMFWGGAVKKVGNGIISLLCKIHIVKKPDKWREKLAHEVDLYKNCLYEIKNHPGMSFINFFCNLGQRMCHVLIPCFVLMAAGANTDPLGLCVCSALVIIGYNSIPLPGGVGVYELLYVKVYFAMALEGNFLLSALMVSRFISFYLIMIGCGLYTLAYHIQVMRRTPAKEPSEGETEEGENTSESDAETDPPDGTDGTIVMIAEETKEEVRETNIGEEHEREREERGNSGDRAG